jgi:hypothetical protein
VADGPGRAFAPGGIRKGAAGYIRRHPKANDEAQGEALIEMRQLK